LNICVCRAPAAWLLRPAVVLGKWLHSCFRFRLRSRGDSTMLAAWLPCTVSWLLLGCSPPILFVWALSSMSIWGGSQHLIADLHQCCRSRALHCTLYTAPAMPGTRLARRHWYLWLVVATPPLEADCCALRRWHPPAVAKVAAATHSQAVVTLCDVPAAARRPQPQHQTLRRHQRSPRWPAPQLRRPGLCRLPPQPRRTH